MTEDARSPHNVVQNTLRNTLLSQGMSSKNASESAAALADLWQRAGLIRISIEELAQGKEPREPLLTILRELEDLDWEALWLTSRIHSVWRQVAHATWKSVRDDIELTEQSIASWWCRERSPAEAAQRIVELRRLARRLATSLSTYDLLAIGESRRVSRSRAALRNIVEKTKSSAERVLEMLDKK